VHGETQCKAAKEYYQLKVPISVVWPASIPPADPTPRDKGQPVLRFGQLGRLALQKGGEFSISAMAQLLKSGHQAELHFFGDGPDRSRLEELSKSLGLSAAVYFHGRYSWRDLDRVATQIDVALMPSIYEGFGLVVLEMMSRGRPVISSDVGSSREILEKLGGGWVVERADTESLWRAMAECCAKRQIVEEQGRRAVEVWQRHFTPEAMVERYLTFWRSCAGPGNDF
jgi:glycosyltransferase involved in cell wall biosynthesis